MIIYHNGSRSIQIAKWMLFSENPHCHWCGILTVWIQSGSPGGGGRKDVSPLLATIDHLTRQRRGAQRVVLACNACNQFRSLRQQLKLHPRAIEKMWEKLRIAEQKYIERLRLAA